MNHRTVPLAHRPVPSWAHAAVWLGLVALVVAALLGFGPGASAQTTPAPGTASISAPDPSGDVTVGGNLEPLLGSQEIYDAADLTAVSATVASGTYALQARTVGPLTGASDILMLATEVAYDLTWFPVSRRGKVAEIAQKMRVAVGADGVTIEENSLPNKCRNASGFAVTATTEGDAGVLTVTVPRTCTRSVFGVPSGIANLSVTSSGFGPAGTFASSYTDTAAVTGIARLAPTKPR